MQEQEAFKTLGCEITRLRSKAGLTPKDLAESVGCRSTYIEAVEDGSVEPSDDFVRKLESRLGAASGSLELFSNFKLEEEAAARAKVLDEAREQRIKFVISAFGIALGVTFCGLLLKGGFAPSLGTLLGVPLFPGVLFAWLPIKSDARIVVPLIGWIVYFCLEAIS